AHGRPLVAERFVAFVAAFELPSLAAFFTVALFAVFFAVFFAVVFAGVFFVGVFFAGAFFAGAFFATALFGLAPELSFVSGTSSRGQFFSVSRYSWRTSAILSGRFSTVQSPIGIAGYTTTSTVPGLNVLESRAAMTSALRITIGTIGIRAAIAMRNGPFLNGPTSVVSSRVPSGAIRIDSP